MKTDNNTPNNSRDENVYAAPDSAPVLAKKKTGFRFVELAVVLAILCILVAMLIPNVRQVRGPARRTQCLNALRQISLAMINYESANGHFLPAYIADENGTPMHSWRVLLLPHMEENALYQKYSMDEPWNGPNNSKLHDEIVQLYRCPSSDSAEHCSDYVLVTGEGTAFDASKTTSYSDLADGSSNTTMMVEIFNADDHWMKPQDITIDQFLTGTAEEVTPNHPHIRNVALFDGSTHCIGIDIPDAELRKLVLIADGEKVNILDW